MRGTRLRRYRVTAAAVALVGTALMAGCGADKDTEKHAKPTPSGSAASPPARHYEQYVALGDSYTSAPGVPEQYGGACGRSRSNYPSQIAAALGATLVDRSCSGARIEDFTTSQLPGQPPQLDGLDDRTELVTVGIGANPTVSRALFFGCASVRSSGTSQCERQAIEQGNGTDLLLGAIAMQETPLAAAIAAIHARAPQARLLLIGYPSIFPETGECLDRLPVRAPDVAYARRIVAALNASLAKVADRSGAEFVDTTAATKGHDMCADDPWIQGKETTPGIALFYHPRVEEQQAVARLVLDRLR